MIERGSRRTLFLFLGILILQMTSRFFERRFLLVVLMICAILCAQVSALALENEHHHSSQHCCALCHVGLPFVQPVVSATAPPVLSTAWLAAFADQDTPHQVMLGQASSRSPPA